MDEEKFKISLRPSKKFFTEMLAIIAIVLIWRGLWNLLDMYVFPENPILSNLISLVLGTLLIYLPNKDLKELM